MTAFKTKISFFLLILAAPLFAQLPAAFSLPSYFGAAIVKQDLVARRANANFYRGLVAAYKLDETSGDRSSSYGAANTLTDNNTVASSGTSKWGNSADFELDNSEYLSIADNADFSGSNVDLTFAVWAQLETKAASGTNQIISKFLTTGNQREYNLAYSQASDRFVFTVSATGTSTVTSVTASSLGSPSTATWYMIIVWHDAANDVIGIQVNNGTANTAAHTTGVFDGTAAFHLGAGGTVANFYDGLMDNVFFWKNRVLSDGEKTLLYNAGAGLNFPF